jgi:hypothetical protein
MMAEILYITVQDSLIFHHITPGPSLSRPAKYASPKARKSDNILQPAQRVAQATKQSVEELLVTALQAALPTLEGLPPDVGQHLVALESLDDQTLWRVMLETVPRDQQHQLHDLLLRNQAGMLTDTEREQLAILQQQADLVMLRKARAAVLLRFRGKRVPTLAELSQLAATDK